MSTERLMLQELQKTHTNENLFWILGIIVSLGLLVYLMIDTARKRPRKGLMHVAFGIGVVLMITARSLTFMHAASTRLLMTLLLGSGLAVAAAIFFFLLPVHPVSPGKLSAHDVFKAIAGLVVVLALALLGVFVASRYDPSGGVGR